MKLSDWLSMVALLSIPVVIARVMGAIERLASRRRGEQQQVWAGWQDDDDGGLGPMALT